MKSRTPKGLVLAIFALPFALALLVCACLNVPLQLEPNPYAHGEEPRINP